MEDVRTLLGVMSEGGSEHGPFKEVNTIGHIDVRSMPFVLVPHAPSTLRQWMYTSVDDTMGGQRQNGLKAPVPKIVAGVMDNLACTRPIVWHTWYVGGVHVIQP